MNFKPFLLAKVLDGSKTQTRRLKKPGEVLSADFTIWPHHYRVRLGEYGRLKWQSGRTYAVAPGRGKPGVARIKLLEISLTCAALISDEAAQAEGFADRESFLETWDAINGPDKRTEPCWALTFELVRPPNIVSTFNAIQDQLALAFAIPPEYFTDKDNR